MKDLEFKTDQTRPLPPKWIDRAKEIRRNQDFKEIYSNLISKHVSFIITATLSYTSVTPHAVTIAMFFLGFAGFFFLCLGNPYGFFLGGVFFILLNIADAVDGELARYKNVTSIGGDYLDRLAHYSTNSLAILGTGIGLFLQYQNIYILVIACIIEIIYTLDEIARDLLITCGLQSAPTNEINRKSLKLSSKISPPKKLQLFFQLTGTNLAFFHLLLIFSGLDLMMIYAQNYSLTDVYFVFSYAAFFSFVTLAKFISRTLKIRNEYFKK